MTLQKQSQFAEIKNSEMHELFLDELADILNAEQQLTKALSKMAGAAMSEQLQSSFQSHHRETVYHITRLEQVFASLAEPVQRKQCKAMKGLLAEVNELMEEMVRSAVLDTALIAVAQKVEHYEIASYGTLCAWAKKLGYDDAAKLLDATLDEELVADEMLTVIAESFANELMSY